MNDLGLHALTTLVHDCASSGVQRQALLLRTDLLPPSLHAAAQLGTARQALDPLLTADRSRAHELADGRVVVSWRGEAPLLLRQALDRLDAFLQADPLDAPSISRLVGVFALPDEGETLLREATAAPRNAKPAQTETRPDLPQTLQPLDLRFLDRLEQALAAADMSRFARRRTVCHASGNTMRLAWEQRRLSVGELIETVAPGRNAKADPWLFRRLTRVLDRRMLAILGGPAELAGAGPFDITLNVATLLSPEFLRFDAALPAGLRNRVVISLLPVDIVADAAAFAFARNFARARSYRLCVRRVSAGLLPALDLAALGLDYVELTWSDELAALDHLPDPGNARWVLGYARDKEAISWGRRAGISLFTTPPTA